MIKKKKRCTCNRENIKKQQREKHICFQIFHRRTFHLHKHRTKLAITIDNISVKWDREQSASLCIRFTLLNFKYRKSFLRLFEQKKKITHKLHVTKLASDFSPWEHSRQIQSASKDLRGRYCIVRIFYMN